MVYLRRFLSKIAEMRVNLALSDPDTTSLNLARSNVKLCKFELKHSSVQNAKNIVFFSLGRIQRLRSLTHSTGMLIIRSSKHETKAMNGTNQSLFNHSSTFFIFFIFLKYFYFILLNFIGQILYVN